MSAADIDRLARIAEAHVRPNLVRDYPGATPYAGLGFHGGTEAVRAILQALREPSEEMRQTLRSIERDYDLGVAGAWLVWEDMIDALLAE